MHQLSQGSSSRASLFLTSMSIFSHAKKVTSPPTTQSTPTLKHLG